MYTVSPYRNEIRLISNLNGLVGVYLDYESFLGALTFDFVERRIVTTFRAWPQKTTWLDFWKINETYEKFVVRDEFGSVFTSNEVLNDFFATRRIQRQYKKWSRAWIRNNFVYRETPVPSTGKLRGCFKSYYKRPKTTQERRWACAHGKYVRGKRRSHVLPDSWDDMPRGDIDNRKCWKNKKIGRQWMKNIGS